MTDTPPEGPEPPGDRHRLEDAFERVLAATPKLVIVPVVILLLAGVGAFVYDADVLVESIREVIRHPVPVGNKIGLFLLIVDLALIGATLIIAAIGLYELFISRVDTGGRRRLPAWLEVRDLNDLKARVIAMIVLVAAVSFVEVVVDLGSGLEVLEVGGGIALVIGALTLFVRFGSQGPGGSNH